MNEIASEVRAASRRGTAFGILTVILGVLAMMAPMISGLAVATMVAFILIIAGVFRLIWAFGSHSFGRGVLTFVIGGLTLLAGILVLIRPMVGLMSLTLLLAAFFLVDGIFEIIGAFQIKAGRGLGLAALRGRCLGASRLDDLERLAGLWHLGDWHPGRRQADVRRFRDDLSRISGTSGCQAGRLGSTKRRF